MPETIRFRTDGPKSPGKRKLSMMTVTPRSRAVENRFLTPMGTESPSEPRIQAERFIPPHNRPQDWLRTSLRPANVSSTVREIVSQLIGSHVVGFESFVEPHSAQ
jgi:hypothetical protein